jgi:hypothetical protein
MSREIKNAYGTENGPSKSATMREYVKAQYEVPRQHTVNCPVCKGTGQLPHPKLGLRTDEGAGVALSIMAKALREQKYSLREIGKFLGYNSPRSVQNLLKKHGMK